jgi:hypothetical protein
VPKPDPFEKESKYRAAYSEDSNSLKMVLKASLCKETKPRKCKQIV